MLFKSRMFVVVVVAIVIGISAGIAAQATDSLLVTNTNNYRVQQFTLGGTYIREWKDLSQAADETYAQYLKAIKTGADESSAEIPKKYWAEGIRKLDPIRVYRHMNNIVVVQREIEEGKYIYVPISSYIPQNGDDGFTFTLVGDSVYDFRRSVRN